MVSTGQAATRVVAAFGLSAFWISTVVLPAVDLAVVGRPAIDLLATHFSTIRLSAINLPAIHLSAIYLPATDFPATNLPAIDLPTIGIATTDFTDPALAAPELTAIATCTIHGRYHRDRQQSATTPIWKCYSAQRDACSIRNSIPARLPKYPQAQGSADYRGRHRLDAYESWLSLLHSQSVFLMYHCFVYLLYTTNQYWPYFLDHVSS